MRNLLITVVASLSVACGSSTPTSIASAPNGLSLAPALFAPAAGSVIHAGDQITFGANYSYCCGSVSAAVEFVRDDGAELMASCTGGTGGSGSGGYRNRVLTTNDPIYKFGLGHVMNAAIAGAALDAIPCPFGDFSGGIN